MALPLEHNQEEIPEPHRRVRLTLEPDRERRTAGGGLSVNNKARMSGGILGGADNKRSAICGYAKGEGIKPNLSIRMSPEILHQARVATVTRKKTLGQWLEEAIVENIERQQEFNKEGEK